jgi:dihydroorotate dehydrogenase
MLFISPPFGNYLSLNNTYSIKGSFTLYPRSGLWSQIFKTLRYSSIYNGWTNKIGLRNKGIDYALQHYRPWQDIISVAILSPEEIPKFLEKIPENTNLELNISCPNIEHQLVNQQLNLFLNPNRKWCIIKLSPLTDQKLIESYYRQGFRQFHCCNTLPVKEGGASGVILKPYVSNLISIIKEYPDTIVIAGGGIQTWNGYLYYKKLGADYCSISTLLFNPFKTWIFYRKFRDNSNLKC